MHKRTHLPVLVVLLGALLFTQSVGAMGSDNYLLNWHTLVNSAGGGPASSTNFQVNLTIGQAPNQASSSPNYRASLGYWAGMLREWLLRLPLILRMSS